MESDRKIWNQQQGVLRQALEATPVEPGALALCLEQHARLHAARMSRAGLWSFEDEIWQGLDETGARRVPPGGEHSIAWVIWHLARIEDVTMNQLVAGQAPVLDREGWLARLCIEINDTGNALDRAGVAALSREVDLETLQAYRLAVGKQTRAIVQQLSPQDLHRKVDPARLEQLRQSGAVGATASGLLDYWGKRDLAGLLLMPATRHNFVHLNEALRLKQAVSG
jgi:hypothetical protein